MVQLEDCRSREVAQAPAGTSAASKVPNLLTSIVKYPGVHTATTSYPQIPAHQPRYARLGCRKLPCDPPTACQLYSSTIGPLSDKRPELQIVSAFDQRQVNNLLAFPRPSPSSPLSFSISPASSSQLLCFAEFQNMDHSHHMHAMEGHEGHGGHGGMEDMCSMNVSESPSP